MSYMSFPVHTLFYNDVQGVLALDDSMEKRACNLAVYIIENGATVRAAAKQFGISKSTVHKDISERLAYYNHSLYQQVQAVLAVNKAERHIRGGIATQKKYRERRNSAP